MLVELVVECYCRNFFLFVDGQANFVHGQSLFTLLVSLEGPEADDSIPFLAINSAFEALIG